MGIRRSMAWNNTRTIIGWVLFAVFAVMVGIWTTLGFAPGLVDHASWPISDFGGDDVFWPILAGFIAGGGAAWALAPGLRIEGGESSGGEGGVGLSPLAAAILGPAALLMMFSAYWPCTGEDNEFWSALRHALEAFEGYVAEPFGVVQGCPETFPQTLMAGVLFGKTTVALVILIAVAFVFRRSIDAVRARMARQIVIFAGLSDQTAALARELARGTTARQTILILDDGSQLARARELAHEFSREHHKTIAMSIDITDDEAIARFMRRRGAKGIHGLYLLLPEGTANLKAMHTFLQLHDEAVGRRSRPGKRENKVRDRDHAALDRAKLDRAALSISPERTDRRIARHLPPDAHTSRRVAPLWWRLLVSKLRPLPSEVPGRAVIRIDNPWHAEEWRRRQMLDRRGWLFDAVSTHSTAARHAVHRMKFPPHEELPITRIVVQGASSFELAVLAELAFERAVDLVLEGAAREGFRGADLTASDERATADQIHAADANRDALDKWRSTLPPTPEVVLLGAAAQEAGEHFSQLLTRYGAPPAQDSMTDAGVRDLAELMDDDNTVLLTGEHATADPTLIAVAHPRWRIIAWSEFVRGLDQRPMIGGLSLVGPTLEPVVPASDPDSKNVGARVDDAAAAYGLDVWERLGRIEHKCYLLRNYGGVAKRDEERLARGDWDADLTETLREDNIRPFATLVRTITDLGYSWASDVDLDGSQTRVELDADHEDWLRAGVNEHASWVRHRLEDGWAFGGPKLRDDARRIHPNIVGWDQLTTKIQGYDFDGVRSALDLFGALGFVLARNREQRDEDLHDGSV